MILPYFCVMLLDFSVTPPIEILQVEMHSTSHNLLPGISYHLTIFRLKHRVLLQDSSSAPQTPENPVNISVTNRNNEQQRLGDFFNT